MTGFHLLRKRLFYHRIRVELPAAGTQNGINAKVMPLNFSDKSVSPAEKGLGAAPSMNKTRYPLREPHSQYPMVADDAVLKQRTI
jgi:hypothetical protein